MNAERKYRKMNEINVYTKLTVSMPFGCHDILRPQKRSVTLCFASMLRLSEAKNLTLHTFFYLSSSSFSPFFSSLFFFIFFFFFYLSLLLRTNMNIYYYVGVCVFAANYIIAYIAFKIKFQLEIVMCDGSIRSNCFVFFCVSFLSTINQSRMLSFCRTKLRYYSFDCVTKPNVQYHSMFPFFWCDDDLSGCRRT